MALRANLASPRKFHTRGRLCGRETEHRRDAQIWHYMFSREHGGCDFLSHDDSFIDRAQFADRYGFDGLCKAVQESGIRGCLGKIVMDIATYAKDPKWAMHPGLVEDREMSLLGAVKMHEKWNGKADDRIRVWFGARTPGGYVSPEINPLSILVDQSLVCRKNFTKR